MESQDDTGGQKIEVDIPEGTIFKDQNQNIYENIINAPQFLDVGQIQNSPANNIIAIVEVGGQNQEIHFEDQNQNTSFVDITVPLPGYQSGEKVNIYSSTDKSTRSFLTEATIASSGTISYITFKTSHFTTFVLGFPYNFFVGNSACTSELTETTYTGIVNMCVTTTSGGVLASMKFSLDGGALRTLITPIGYSSNYAISLTGLGMTSGTQ